MSALTSALEVLAGAGLMALDQVMLIWRARPRRRRHFGVLALLLAVVALVRGEEAVIPNQGQGISPAS